MNRRRLLSEGSVLLGALLCGCQRQRSTDSAGSTVDTGESENADRPSLEPHSTPSTRTTNGEISNTAAVGTTETAATRIAGRELTVGDRSCASGNDDAGRLAVENGIVVVSGTLTGRNGCTTARLDAATYDRSADRLRVVLTAAARTTPGAVCAQCLTAIAYEVRVAFDGGPPGTVLRIERGATGEQRTQTELG